jgi:hypothetical protein
MIKQSTQNWTAGATVKVGFLTLKVQRAIPTPGDYAPDAYLLTNLAGTQIYQFVPHNGLIKVTPAEARDLIEAADRHAARIAAQAMAKAQQAAQVAAVFA